MAREDWAGLLGCGCREMSAMTQSLGLGEYIMVHGNRQAGERQVCRKGKPFISFSWKG